MCVRSLAGSCAMRVPLLRTPQEARYPTTRIVCAPGAALEMGFDDVQEKLLASSRQISPPRRIVGYPSGTNRQRVVAVLFGSVMTTSNGTFHPETRVRTCSLSLPAVVGVYPKSAVSPGPVSRYAERTAVWDAGRSAPSFARGRHFATVVSFPRVNSTLQSG